MIDRLSEEFLPGLRDRIIARSVMIDWVLFVPKGTIRWRSALVWLLYPLVYAVYSLIHGAVTGFYPYPFINVGELGYDKMFLNMGVLVLVFFGLGLPDRYRSPHGPQQHHRQGLAHAAAVNLVVSLGRKEWRGGVQKELELMTEPDHRRRKAERTEFTVRHKNTGFDAVRRGAGRGKGPVGESPWLSSSLRFCRSRLSSHSP